MTFLVCLTIVLSTESFRLNGSQVLDRLVNNRLQLLSDVNRKSFLKTLKN